MSKRLDQLIGQLIIAGFRSDRVSDTTNICKYIKNYNLSGVILYDEDLEKIISHIKGLGYDISNIKRVPQRW